MKKLIIVFLVLIVFALNSCDINSGSVVSRTYWFASYNEVNDLVQDMNIVSDFNYVFKDLSNENYIIDSCYGVQARFYTSGDPLNKADKGTPTFTFVYETDDDKFDAIILYVVARRQTEDEINLTYKSENIVPKGLVANEEVNDLLEGTNIKPFVSDLYDRLNSNNAVWESSYLIYNNDNEDDYYMAITFIYSQIATSANNEFEELVMNDLIVSEIEIIT
jgi:hypothetical protein